LSSLYVANIEAGLVKRQAEKGRRIVRIRGRQREDRQLFLEPVPVAFNQPNLVIPAQPILQRVVQQQPQVQLVQQPIQVWKISLKKVKRETV